VKVGDREGGPIVRALLASSAPFGSWGVRNQASSSLLAAAFTNENA